MRLLLAVLSAWVGKAVEIGGVVPHCCGLPDGAVIM